MRPTHQMTSVDPECPLVSNNIRLHGLIPRKSVDASYRVNGYGKNQLYAMSLGRENFSKTEYLPQVVSRGPGQM